MFWCCREITFSPSPWQPLCRSIIKFDAANFESLVLNHVCSFGSTTSINSSVFFCSLNDSFVNVKCLIIAVHSFQWSLAKLGASLLTSPWRFGCGFSLCFRLPACHKLHGKSSSSLQFRRSGHFALWESCIFFFVWFWTVQSRFLLNLGLAHSSCQLLLGTCSGLWVSLTWQSLHSRMICNIDCASWSSLSKTVHIWLHTSLDEHGHSEAKNNSVNTSFSGSLIPSSLETLL